MTPPKKPELKNPPELLQQPVVKMEKHQDNYCKKMTKQALSMNKIPDTISSDDFKSMLSSGKIKTSSVKYPESELQQRCVKAFRQLYPGEVIYSIPNGGNRDVKVAQILKAEGTLAGVPDLFVMAARAAYHGLYIEMKFGKNGLIAEQINFFVKAQKQGYKCVVCKSVDEFHKEVEEYLCST